MYWDDMLLFIPRVLLNNYLLYMKCHLTYYTMDMALNKIVSILMESLFNRSLKRWKWEKDRH